MDGSAFRPKGQGVQPKKTRQRINRVLLLFLVLGLKQTQGLF